ncbi:hypothetical protein WJM97_00690 [Okeanomitos corallinicola TIOX110]|uniref:Uncharacterized protein n=1 Tax=Okeanomitos corallinicola TIOX110 TaxID=3133117 RepID=A0ABZ2UXJ5_9CYAN
MSHNNSLTSFCKQLLTVTSLSVITAVSIPSQAFSLTTEIAEIKDKSVSVQELQNNSATSFLSGETSELLLAKKDKDKYKDRDYKDRKGKKRSSKKHRQKDWDCDFTVGRLLNSNNKSLVLYLDILQKPETKYANVVYQVYAKKKNTWKAVYTSTGSRLIKKYGAKYRLEPEIIEFKKLGIKDKDFDKTDLKFVAQIRYDYQNRRDERFVIEDTWNYDYITEYTNVSQVTEVNYTEVNEREGSYRRDDRYERRDDDRYERRDDDRYERRDDDKYERREVKDKGKKRYSYKAYKDKDWDCEFKLGKLVNTNKKAFVVYLDIFNKPATKYANVVYVLYARQNNRWVQVHTSTGARLIKQKGKKHYLNPEVIEFSKLRLGNINLSKSDLKFVTEIRYDTETRREQRVVVENTWNYSSISEISSVRELDVVEY